MFDLFKFSLPLTITQHLIGKLEKLSPTPLTKKGLEDLADFQAKHEVQAGVFLLYVDGKVAGAGKADHLAHHMAQQLRSRDPIGQQEVQFKALLLDDNWTAMVREDLIVEHFLK